MLSTLNLTSNAENAWQLLHTADVIYIIMGCFVAYRYFSALPPTCDEVYSLLKDTNGKKHLFYVMGTLGGISPDFQQSALSTILTTVEHGNTYRALLENCRSTPTNDLIAPNYPLLSAISSIPAPLLETIRRPYIVEIETGTGCNTPTCSFCIESVRSPKVTYREPEDIVAQIQTFYQQGARHFRLGRQPNFFHYHRQNTDKLRQLLEGIRQTCPELRTLHIDNVNIVNVISPRGHDFARLVATYCTSGNVAPFGIESFDDEVRAATRVAGTADDAMRAIQILNEVGAERGDDGLPRLLPGINLIYNLPGQTHRTHERNMRYLQTILESGLLTRRLYYRNMTQPTGASFGTTPVATDEYEQQFQDIVTNYVLPMQSRVFPKGLRVFGDWEHVTGENTLFARTIGTCTIKVELDSERGAPGSRESIEILGNAGYRSLRGLRHSPFSLA